jgi:hypothetical protein
MQKLLFILFILSGFIKAQDLPVKSEVIQDNSTNFKICFKVDENWMVYDKVNGEDGPIPLQIEFNNLQNIQVSNTEKPKLKSKFDDVFEVNIDYFDSNVCYNINTQKINSAQPAQITIDYTYMMCNLKTGICLPPTSNSSNLLFK